MRLEESINNTIRFELLDKSTNVDNKYNGNNISRSKQLRVLNKEPSPLRTFMSGVNNVKYMTDSFTAVCAGNKFYRTMNNGDVKIRLNLFLLGSG